MSSHTSHRWLPSGRLLWPVAALLVATIVRIAAVAGTPFPTEDAAYYVEVARNLVTGHGLITNGIWRYQTSPLVFPRPAFELWQPLPTWLAAVPMRIFGPTFAAARLAPLGVGPALVALAWYVAHLVADERVLSGHRRTMLEVGTILVVACYQPLAFTSGTPDSTAPFALLVLAGCLWMAVLLTQERPRNAHLALLGVLLTLAAMARNEAAYAALVWVIMAPSRREWAWSTRWRAVLVPGIVAVACYAPWAWRDLVVFGTPLPGQALPNALSIRNTDIFAYRDAPTFARYLAQGPGPIIAEHVAGVVHNVIDVLLLPGAPSRSLA